MTGILRRISDYDRVSQELGEARKRLAQLEDQFDETRSELEKVTRQLEGALEKAGAERRRRAEEEERRGRAERELEDKSRELERLTRDLVAVAAPSPDVQLVAVLDRETELDASQVMGFLQAVQFREGRVCLSAAVGPAGCAALLGDIPGMAAWVSRIGRGGRGIVAFTCGNKACFLEPPLPVQTEERKLGEAFDYSIIEPCLKRPLVGLISVHRDMYALCILNGKVREWVFEEKDVIGRSKKGGSSQARFSRSREDQVKHLLLEAGEVAGDILARSRPEYVLLEGDDRTLAAFRDSFPELDAYRVVRLTLPGKITKELVEDPGFVWRWRAWVFDLPPTPHQPSG